MSILVPLDGSLVSEQALPFASELASRSAATLHLVRVHVPAVQLGSEITYAFNGELDAELRLAEDRYLSGHARRIRADRGVNTLTLVLSGLVASALEAYVKDAGIGLVVLTTHGRGGLRRALLGSVADGLVRRLPVPVVLLRPRLGAAGPEAVPFTLDHILIPLDGSEFSECVIEPATVLGRLSGASYTLLHVLASHPALPGGLGNAERPQPGIDDQRAEMVAYLEAIAHRLRAEGLRAEVRVIEGTSSAAAVIEESVAEGVSMIALATHGRTGWRRVAMGSIADMVMRGASVPILLMRPSVTPASTLA